MDPGAGPAAIQWTLNYPAAAVAQIAAVAGPAATAANKTLTCTGNSCVLWGLNAQTIQSGVVAVVAIELSGASGDVPFQLTGAFAASPPADPILISTASAPLVVTTKPPAFPREAALPLETRNATSYFLACDNTNGISTEVSIANMTAVPANILVVIWDNSGMQIDSASISLPGHGHIAFVASEQFTSVANRSVTVEFETPVGGQISLVGMRFHPDGGFTTIPLASSDDTGNGSMAHLAVGGGWTTSIQLINLGNTTVQAHVRFFDDNGLALTLPVTASGGATTTASVDPLLPPHSTMAIESTGTDDSLVQSGSVHVRGDGQVAGFVRFRYAPLHQEAIAPLEMQNPGSYILVFDNTDGLATGVAVANVASAAGTIPVIIRDATGALIGSETITIPGDGHTAFSLSDRFPATANQRGTLEFFTPPGGQVSVLGMRFLPSGGFSIIPVVVP
jgi:hypothetical protein